MKTISSICMTKLTSDRDGIRFFLSRETRSLHEIVDKQAEINDLASREGVGRLLTFFYRGFSQIERALEAAGAGKVLKDWDERKRSDLLKKDLAGFGVLVEDLGQDWVKPMEFSSAVEIWGALYVIEGSRLGARMMVRASEFTQASAFLSESAECRYWPTFVAELNRADEQLADREGMARGAQKAFQAFL